MSALKAIYASARALGLDEDTRRDFYQKVTGKRSLVAMIPAEHAAVLNAMRKAGAKPVPGGRKLLTGPYAKKLQALWIAGWNLSVVKNRDDKAMLSFIERQTGIQNTAFLRDAAHARAAIEALKSWLAREGGVDWAKTSADPDWLTEPARVAEAQLKILRVSAPGFSPLMTLERWVTDAGYPSLRSEQFESHMWVPITNGLGERIRTLPIRVVEPKKMAG